MDYIKEWEESLGRGESVVDRRKRFGSKYVKARDLYEDKLRKQEFWSRQRIFREVPKPRRSKYEPHIGKKQGRNGHGV